MRQAGGRMKNGGGRARAFKLLGLAQRAVAVERGVDATRCAVRDGRARLVLIAEDASNVQLKKIAGLLEHRPVPQRQLGGQEALGAALGAGPLSAVAITLQNFAEPMLHYLPVNRAGYQEGLDEARGGQ